MPAWEPSWVYSNAPFETTWTKAYDNRGYYYYFDSKDPQATITWDKPAIFTDQEKKWKEWEDMLATDPVWQKKRDRFGRWQFYNKETKKSQDEMPQHWWTYEQRAVLREAEARKIREEEERKARIIAEREARIAPKLKEVHKKLLEYSDRFTSPTAEKLLAKDEQPVPCFGLCAIKQDNKEKWKSFQERRIASYDARRVPLPPMDGPSYFVGGDVPFAPHRGRIMFALFEYSTLRSGHGNHWPVLVTQIISLYCDWETPLLEKGVVLPLHMCGSSFDDLYYQKHVVGVDRKLIGYDDARVSALEVGADGRRQEALVAQDSIKELKYTNEQWDKWWEQKNIERAKKLKRMLKMRSMGYDESTGKYDFEFWENLEAQEAEGDAAAEDEGDWEYYTDDEA